MRRALRFSALLVAMLAVWSQADARGGGGGGLACGFPAASGAFREAVQGSRDPSTLFLGFIASLSRTTSPGFAF